MNRIDLIRQIVRDKFKRGNLNFSLPENEILEYLYNYDLDRRVELSLLTPYTPFIDDGSYSKDRAFKLALEAYQHLPYPGLGMSFNLIYNQYLEDSKSYNYNRYRNLSNQIELNNHRGHYPDSMGKTAYHPTFSTDSPYSGYKNPYNPNGITGGTWGDNFYLLSDSLILNNWDINRTIDYLLEAEDNGVLLLMPDGSLPLLDNGDYYGGVLPNVNVTAKRKFGDGGGEEYTTPKGIIKSYRNTIHDLYKDAGEFTSRGLDAFNDLMSDWDLLEDTDVKDYFKSYVNSLGFDRIRLNLRKWWEDRHPYRKYLSWLTYNDTAKDLKLNTNKSDTKVFNMNMYDVLSFYSPYSDNAYVGTLGDEFPYSHSAAHEYAHGVNDWPSYKEGILREVLDLNTNTNNNHDSKPDEKHSDVWGTKYLLYKEGIYDSRSNKDVTPELILKLRDKYSELRLLKLMDNNKAAWMLNHTANNNVNNSNIIALGGNLYDGATEGSLLISKSNFILDELNNLSRIRLLYIETLKQGNIKHVPIDGSAIIGLMPQEVLLASGLPVRLDDGDLAGLFNTLPSAVVGPYDPNIDYYTVDGNDRLIPHIETTDKWLKYWSNLGSSYVNRALDRASLILFNGAGLLGNPIGGALGIAGSMLGENLGYRIAGNKGALIGGLAGGFIAPDTYNFFKGIKNKDYFKRAIEVAMRTSSSADGLSNLMFGIKNSSLKELISPINYIFRNKVNHNTHNPFGRVYYNSLSGGFPYTGVYSNTLPIHRDYNKDLISAFLYDTLLDPKLATEVPKDYDFHAQYIAENYPNKSPRVYETKGNITGKDMDNILKHPDTKVSFDNVIGTEGSIPSSRKNNLFNTAGHRLRVIKIENPTLGIEPTYFRKELDIWKFKRNQFKSKWLGYLKNYKNMSIKDLGLKGALTMPIRERLIDMGLDIVDDIGNPVVIRTGWNKMNPDYSIADYKTLTKAGVIKQPPSIDAGADFDTDFILDLEDLTKFLTRSKATNFSKGGNIYAEGDEIYTAAPSLYGIEITAQAPRIYNSYGLWYRINDLGLSVPIDESKFNFLGAHILPNNTLEDKENINKYKLYLAHNADVNHTNQFARTVLGLATGLTVAPAITTFASLTPVVGEIAANSSIGNSTMLFMSRPVSAIAKGTTEYIPQVSKVLPYTESIDRGIWGTSGLLGMKNAYEGWQSGEKHWSNALAEGALSGLMLGEMSPAVKYLDTLSGNYGSKVLNSILEGVLNKYITAKNLYNLKDSDFYKNLILTYGKDTASLIIKEIATPEFLKFFFGEYPNEALRIADEYNKLAQIIKDIENVGGVLTGSAGLARQGTVGRTGIPHDLDFNIPSNSKSFIEKLNGLGFKPNAASSRKLLKITPFFVGKSYILYPIARDNIGIDLFETGSLPQTSEDIVKTILDGKKLFGRKKDLTDIANFKPYSFNNPLINTSTGETQWNPTLFNEGILTQNNLPMVKMIETYPGSGIKVPVVMNYKGEMRPVGEPINKWEIFSAPERTGVSNKVVTDPNDANFVLKLSKKGYTKEELLEALFKNTILNKYPFIQPTEYLLSVIGENGLFYPIWRLEKVIPYGREAIFGKDGKLLPKAEIEAARAKSNEAVQSILKAAQEQGLQVLNGRIITPEGLIQDFGEFHNVGFTKDGKPVIFDGELDRFSNKGFSRGNLFNGYRDSLEIVPLFPATLRATK